MAHQLVKRYRVWLYGFLPNARILAGVTLNTSPRRPAGSRNPPSVTSKSQSSLDFHSAASRCSRAGSVTRTAVPSTTTSSPARNWLAPAARTQPGLACRFFAFCSCDPAQKCSVPSSQIAGSGVTCGRPSRRTVDSQNISVSDSTPATSVQVRAAAPGSLNPSFSSAVGSVSGIGALLYRGSCACTRPDRRQAGAELIAVWRGSHEPGLAERPIRAPREGPGTRQPGRADLRVRRRLGHGE